MPPYVMVKRPPVGQSEFDRLEDGARECNTTRPETLGYQTCWREADHDSAHISQDGRAWITYESEADS